MSSLPNPYEANYGKPPSQGMSPPNSPYGMQWSLLGVVFIVLASIGFLFDVLGTLGNIISYANGENAPPPNLDGAGRTGHYIGLFGAYAMVAVSGLLQPVILWAGINMLRRKGSTMIWSGAIIACIPGITSCCLLGIPFGVWAIILLIHPEAKRLIL